MTIKHNYQDVSKLDIPELKENLNTHRRSRKTSTVMAFISAIAMIWLIIIDLHGNGGSDVDLWIVLAAMHVWSLFMYYTSGKKIKIYWRAIQRRMPQ